MLWHLSTFCPKYISLFRWCSYDIVSTVQNILYSTYIVCIRVKSVRFHCLKLDTIKVDLSKTSNDFHPLLTSHFGTWYVNKIDWDLLKMMIEIRSLISQGQCAWCECDQLWVQYEVYSREKGWNAIWAKWMILNSTTAIWAFNDTVPT